jgi:transcription elongation factor Elf1
MNEIDISEFKLVRAFEWTCPLCKHSFTTQFDNIIMNDHIHCDHCGEIFEIIVNE